MSATNDTIFALSSGAPPAAIAVMRVSGPAAGDALAALCGDRPPAPRRATLRTLLGSDAAVLDRALVLWLPGPQTSTGEDVAELHLHGGRATVAAVDAALRELGLRPARGGEFTRRALEHGRIDLTQAEGLADLLAAETEAERRAALATSEGAVSRALSGWYQQLTGISALIEARLDHADEDDVGVPRDTIDAAAEGLLGDMREVLARPTVERLRDGATIVLAGPPNAGKSSLFNALLKREAAIVTAEAGTTRDVLDAAVMRNGRPYRILDTAGIRVADSEVERIGIVRAEEAASRADLVIWLGDEPPSDANSMWINARCDLPDRAVRPGTVLNVSAFSASSIEELWRTIEDVAGTIGNSRPFLLATHQRKGVVAIEGDVAAVMGEPDDLLMAEHLRRALSRLDEMLGRSAPERVLDDLFSRFCIGK